MLPVNIFLFYVTPLNELGIPYMVSGSVAMMAFGEPRLTHDVDIIVKLEAKNIAAFHQAFHNGEFYIPPVEIIEIEARRQSRGHLNIIHHKTGFKADVYLSSDSLHVWALEKRISFEVEGTTVWMAPPEYVIIRKLEYFQEGGSEKHLRDIRSILDVSRERIDESRLLTLIEEKGLKDSWNKVNTL